MIDAPGTACHIAARVRNLRPSAIRRMLAVSAQPGMISFAGGLPATDLFDVEGVGAATDEVMDTQARAALQYGATEGLGGLRDGLVDLMRRRGAETQADRIVVTTGAQQALELIGKVTVDPGDVVLVERPTYTTAMQTFRLCGADVVGVASDGAGLLVDDLHRTLCMLRLEGRRARFLYLIPNYSNPAGWVTSAARRRCIAEFAVKERLLVVEDDPYGDLYFDAPPPPSIWSIGTGLEGGKPWFAYLGSLSKVVAPGLRIGWAVLPQHLVGPFIVAKQGSDLQGSTFNQYLAMNYLTAGSLERHLPVLRGSYARRCTALCDALRNHLGNQITFEKPHGGLFIWARLTDGADASVVVDRAISAGVVYVPGAPFFAERPESDTLRLTFATAGDLEIEEGTRRLQAALQV